MQSKPVLSVGMPVYNGAKWIEDAIDSILTQSFTDVELIICDNCSTDETEAICRQAAAKDSRVHYSMNASNIGVHRNYDRVFELSSGKYFKWASCSDICLEGFFEKCVAVLEECDDVVLAYPRAFFLVSIHGANEQVIEYEDQLHLIYDRPSRRFAEYLNREKYNNVMNGIMRASALRQTSLNRPLPGSDISMIAELTLHGKFVEIPDRLFFRRFGFETTGILMDSHSSAGTKSGYMVKPTHGQRIKLHSYRFLTAIRAPISFVDKVLVWAYLIRRYAGLAPLACRKVIRALLRGA